MGHAQPQKGSKIKATVLVNWQGQKKLVIIA
jgi:hypothetical protein